MILSVIRICLLRVFIAVYPEYSFRRAPNRKSVGRFVYPYRIYGASKEDDTGRICEEAGHHDGGGKGFVPDQPQEREAYH